MLIDPVLEFRHTSKYSVALGRRASWGAPAYCSLQYPAASGVLADVRTSTVTMATTEYLPLHSSTQHVVSNLERRSVWSGKQVLLRIRENDQTRSRGILSPAWTSARTKALSTSSSNGVQSPASSRQTKESSARVNQSLNWKERKLLHPRGDQRACSFW